MYVHRGTCAAQCCVTITDYSPSSDGITKQESYKNLGCFKLDMCLLQKWTVCCETISEESWKNIAKIRDFCEQKQWCCMARLPCYWFYSRKTNHRLACAVSCTPGCLTLGSQFLPETFCTKTYFVDVLTHQLLVLICYSLDQLYVRRTTGNQSHFCVEAFVNLPSDSQDSFCS